ncbi:MAG: PTS mannose/fructose/sorbose/N-acetylgalactosamine transporter subunit IIC [Peptostreptococcaceae bacterium]
MVNAILLGLVAMFANAEYLFGTSLLSRPIITGMLTGLVLGDLQTGIILGATLELAFIGAFSVGAALPPEIISGAILGTAFAITTGQGAEVALTLAVPIAALALVIKNTCMIFILPLFVHKADKYAENGDCKGVERMHLLGGFLSVNLPIGLIVFFSYLLGSSAVETILNAIPPFIQNGLAIATGLLPALGFALLAKMIVNKKVVVFYFLGFALSVYLGVPITGIAIFGTMIAIILIGLNKPNQVAVVGGNDDDDDF